MNTQQAIQEYNNLADSLHMDYNHHIHGITDTAGLRKAIAIGHMMLLPRDGLAWLIRALRMDEKLESNPEE